MIVVELPGAWPRATLIGAAHAGRGRRPSLVIGDGWSCDAVAIDPVASVSVPIGTSLDQVTETIGDALGTLPLVGWAGRSAPRAFGYIAYEAARDLERPRWAGAERRQEPLGVAATLQRYAAVAIRDRASGRVAIEADDAASLRALRELVEGTSSVTPIGVGLAPIDGDDVHARRIERALELIAAGDLYQVNLARELTGSTTERSAAALLAGMLDRTTASFGAAFELDDHLVVSSSPELFLDVDDRRISTKPIKGTRPRGADATTDAALAKALDEDPKEQAELTMVMDLERNDLGRIARVGSVRASSPHLVRSRTVHHRVATVVAELADAHVGRLGPPLSAMLPSGSVTGAPKVRAMEVIATLEATRRGIYCGCLFAARDARHFRASMAIRTLVVDRTTGAASYHSGGGIVAGSDPKREVAETLWKARQVMAQ